MRKLLALFLLIALTGWTYGTLPVATVALVSITPSSLNAGPGPFTGTIGVLTVNATGGSFSGTLALSAAGSCSGSPGADNASFTLSSSGSPSNLTASSLANGTYHACVSATQGGATGSPLYQALTITIATTSALTNMTVVETTGSTQTNASFSIGVPFDVSVMDGYHHLQAKFDPTGVNTTLVCDENNRYSDIGGRTKGTPSVRGTTLSCVIPSLPANTTKTIALSVASGAPGSGTDIALTGSNSIVASGYDMPVSIVTLAGTTETASPLIAFNSGNKAWVNTSTAAVMGKWRSGGGIVTGYVSYVPFKSGGGTLDPKGLYAIFDTECYKATTGAVSGGNPIIGCTTDVSIGNGVYQNTDPLPSTIDLNAFSLRVGGGSCLNLVTTSPTQNLTLSSGTAGQTVTASVSTNLFTINDIGRVISDGTGFGTISFFQDGKNADVTLFKAMASGATTLTSGNYKIHGINQPYGGRTHVRCGWTPGGGATAAPSLSVQGGNLYLGNPYSGRAATSGPGTYFISSRAILNYNTAVSPGLSSYSNTPTSTYQGTNPGGLGFITSQSGQGACSNALYGPWTAYEQQSGDFVGKGPDPGPFIGALLKWDSNAASAIFPDVDKWGTMPLRVIDNTTGTTPYVTRTLYQGWVTTDSAAFHGAGGVTTHCWSSWPNSAHGLDAYHIAYVATGDWYLLSGALDYMMGVESLFNESYAGSGIDRHWLGSQGSTGDQRQTANAFFYLGRTTLLLPDSDTNSTPSPLLGLFTKDDAKTSLEDQYTSTGFDGNWTHCAGGSSYNCPGANISLGIGSCPGGATCNPNFVSNSARFTTQSSGFGFETGGFNAALGALYENGMLSTNGKQFWTWLATGLVTGQTDTTDIPSGIFTAVVEHASSDQSPTCGGGGTYYTWADVWHQAITNCNNANGQIGISPREPSGTATLIGARSTIGASITVTMPATGYFAGGSWYVGNTSYFFTRGDHGVCLIRAVADPVITCTVVAPFSSASYTNTAYDYANGVWNIPPAKGGDTNGLEVAGLQALYTANGYDYLNLSQMDACALISPYLSISGAAAACASLLSYTGGSMALFQPIIWNVVHR